MSGYSGYSRSNNAVAAEERGKLPITRATRMVADLAGCTQTVARAALLFRGPDEWHHTSTRFNATNYYDVDAAVEIVEANKLSARISATVPAWIDMISDAIRGSDGSTSSRLGGIHDAAAAIAQDCDGISVDEIVHAYYYHS